MGASVGRSLLPDLMLALVAIAATAWSENVTQFTNFHTLLRLACWKEVEEHVEYFCCAASPELAKRQHCFSTVFSRERCCLSEPPKPAGDAPPAAHDPWRADDACLAFTTARSVTAGVAERSRSCAGARPLFRWDGVVVRALRRVSFRAADVTHCLWKPCRRLALATAARRVPAGRTWRPPPLATAALLFSRSHWEVLPLLQRGARGRAAPAIAAPATSELLWDRPSVYALVLDSVSRMTLRQLMPRTHEFLMRESAEASSRGEAAPESTPEIPANYESIAFPRFHTLQFGGTLAQMFPIFFGGLRRGQKGGQDMVEMMADHRYNITKALAWCPAFPLSALAELRRVGYRLAFAATDFHGVSGIVKTVKWDHALPHVLGVARLVAGQHLDFSCVGPRPYYQVVMRWGLDVLDLHREGPLFLYQHLQAAHVSKKYLPALDVPLREHLREVMRRRPRTLLLLASDHGNLNQPCDQRAPMLHLLVPRGLLVARPEVAAALRRNARELVSGWDLFATFRHLAKFDEARPGDVYDDLRWRRIDKVVASPVKPFQEVTTVDLDGNGFRPRSLFEPLPKRRGCKTAGIAPAHCQYAKGVWQISFCVDWEELTGISQAQHAGLRSLAGQHSEARATERARLPLDQPSAGSIVCRVVGGNMVLQAISDMTKLLEKLDTQGACRHLHLSALEYVASDGGGRFDARFSVREGVPPRLYDVSFALSSARTRTIQDLHIVQVTKYQKYEACAPEGVPVIFCVCDIAPARRM